ncbi:MAG: glycosyltransferase family 2 protein, partial [Solirubrobacterales bacterium]
MSARVAVAVVSFNTRGALGGCLEALDAPGPGGRPEVWVVDNGSTDGSPDLVREHPRARLLEGGNVGFGAAVNRVAAASAAPWIVAANADTAPEPGALEVLVRTGESHPGAGAVAPRLLLDDGRTQHSVHRFPGPGLAAAVSSGLATRSRRIGDRLLIDGCWDPSRARAVDWAHGAFVLFRRSAFEAVGGFDERQWMYAEDLDLAWRLRAGGWEVLYEPSARVRHHHESATAAALGPERELRKSAAAYAGVVCRRGLARAWATAALAMAGP